MVEPLKAGDADKNHEDVRKIVGLSDVLTPGFYYFFITNYIFTLNLIRAALFSGFPFRISNGFIVIYQSPWISLRLNRFSFT